MCDYCKHKHTKDAQLSTTARLLVSFLRKVTFEQSPSLLLYDYLLFVLTKGWKTGTKVSLNKFTVL